MTSVRILLDEYLGRVFERILRERGYEVDQAKDRFAERNIRALVLYYFVLYAGVTYLVFIYLQPVFETVVIDLGVPPELVESLLGVFYAAYSLFGAVLSYYTGAIKRRIGMRTWFVVLPFIVGSALMGLYLLPVLARWP